jgi:hypothetical protein
MSAQVVRFDAYRTTAFGSITSSYVQIGATFAHLMRLVKFVNNTNADVSVSFDGVTNNDFVPANSFCLYDFQTNAQAENKFTTSIGTPIFIKYASGAPTSGSFYIVAVYGQGE